MILKFHISLLLLSTFFECLPLIQGASQDLIPDKDVESVCKTLQMLDKELIEIIQNLPDDGGSKMMRLIKTYNKASHILLEHCKRDKNKTFPPAKDLLEQGGPEFLDTDFEESQLLQRFNWNKEELMAMCEAKKQTNIVWYDLFRFYNNIPIPDA